MISQERQEPHARRWLWAIPLSALLHAFLIPLALAVFAAKLIFPEAHREPEHTVATTSIRFERRPVPRRQGLPAKPQNAPAPQPPQLRPRPPVPQSLPQPALTSTPPPTPKPSATPQPAPREPSTPLEQQLAAQQAAYQRTIAEIHHHDRLSLATVAPQAPASYHRSAFDEAGQSSHELIVLHLSALKHWMAGGLSCYYTQYVAQFSNGATEEGVVPWPVCYPRDDDRIAKFPYPGVPLPIPYPQPGYELPPGTYLSPFLERIYKRSEPQN